MPHKYSVENIYQFTCSNCMGWWSFAQMNQVGFKPILPVKMQQNSTCPHCKHTDSTLRFPIEENGFTGTAF